MITTYVPTYSIIKINCYREFQRPFWTSTLCSVCTRWRIICFRIRGRYFAPMANRSWKDLWSLEVYWHTKWRSDQTGSSCVLKQEFKKRYLNSITVIIGILKEKTTHACLELFPNSWRSVWKNCAMLEMLCLSILIPMICDTFVFIKKTFESNTSVYI